MKVSLEQADGNVEKMIKRFLKKTKKLKIIEGCYDRRYYVKPSAEKHTKKRMKQRAFEREKAAAPVSKED